MYKLIPCIISISLLMLVFVNPYPKPRDGTRIQSLEGQYNFLEGANIIFLGLIFKNLKYIPIIQYFKKVCAPLSLNMVPSLNTTSTFYLKHEISY